LQQCGLQPGNKVGILSKNCAHWVLADLSIALAGMVAVPLYPNISAEAVAEILAHSETQLVFSGKLDQPEAIRSQIPSTIKQIGFPFYRHSDTLQWDHITAATPPLEGPPQIDPAALSCIVYTSGTTGQPKGVMLSFHNMSFAVDAFLKTVPPLFQERFFSYLPLCHVAERMLVECGALYTGSTIYFVESMEKFSQNLQHTQPTIFLAVPRIWEKMKEEITKKLPEPKLRKLLRIPLLGAFLKKSIRKKLGLSRPKLVFTGASPIHIEVLEFFTLLGLEIQEAYGMTENSALSHSNRKGHCRFGTVGQAYEGVTVKLGPDKEVLVKSDASMLGYYKEPEQTAEMFADGFLRTGDEGHIDADGFLTITGRIKDQFKTSKGKYVTPAPIEAKVLTHGLVSQACVVGWGMPAPLLLVTLSEMGKKLVQEQLHAPLTELLEKVNASLEHHEQLNKLVVMLEEWTIDNGKLTPTLKIKRKALDLAFQEFYARWSEDRERILFFN
jgi:long-chain acyl-CoA synthetase